MNKIILLLSIFFCQKCMATTNDTTCQRTFYSQVVGDTVHHPLIVKFDYFDSSNVVYRLTYTNRALFHALQRNKGFTFDKYKEFMISHFMRNKPLDFSDCGMLDTSKHVSHDPYADIYPRERFIKKFFQEGKIYQAERHGYHEQGVFAKAFEYGIAVTYDQGAFRILYNAQCGFDE